MTIQTLPGEQRRWTDNLPSNLQERKPSPSKYESVLWMTWHCFPDWFTMRYIWLLQSISDYEKLFLNILSATPHASLLNFGPWGKGAKLAVLFSMWGKKNLGDPSSQSHISWGMDIKWWESIQDLLHAEPMFSTMDLHLHSSKLMVIAKNRWVCLDR